MRITKNDGSERALSVVLDEARRVPAPELDWCALEAKLEKVVALPAPIAEPRRPSPWVLALLPAAAALTLVGFWVIPHSAPNGAPQVVSARVVDPVKNGDALSAEELLATDSTPMEVAHAGRARWTLEPNSRALVLGHGDVVRVRLVAGALKAEVVPSSVPERFVVEAGGTRVAVHGTVFRVQVRGEQTLVDVEQGVVSVGPREKPSVSTLLRAPTHGEFTLEGKPLATPALSHSASHRLIVAHPKRELSDTSASEVAAPEVAPEASERHSLTIGEAETGVETVVDAISRCFVENTEGSHEVRVSARTELTLEVSAEGAVTEVSFAPPLSPTVQDCGRREALAARFAPSLEGAQLTRVLELSR